MQRKGIFKLFGKKEAKAAAANNHDVTIPPPPKQSPVREVEESIPELPLEKVEPVNRVYHGLAITEMTLYPEFSNKNINNFLRKYAPGSDAVNVLPIVFEGSCFDFPLTLVTTCQEVLQALTTRYPDSRFVVQLGDLMFQLNETVCDQQSWLARVNGHHATIIVCQKDEVIKKDNPLAILHRTGFANPFATKEEPATKSSAYNIVFLNAAGTFSARSQVHLYATEVRDTGNGWVCGTMPELPDAKLWAPTSGDSMKDWVTQLQKFREPVRIMICVNTASRFYSVEHEYFFKRLNRLLWLPAIGSVDIVFTADDERRPSIWQCANYVSNWLYGVPCQAWWAPEKYYYDRLRNASRETVMSITAKMFDDLRNNHGVPMHLVMGYAKTDFNHDVICNTHDEQKLKAIAETIALVLDIEILLRAITTFNSGYATVCQNKLLNNLKTATSELARIPATWFFEKDRRFLENAVHKFRRVHPVCAETVPAPEIAFNRMSRLG